MSDLTKHLLTTETSTPQSTPWPWGPPVHRMFMRDKDFWSDGKLIYCDCGWSMSFTTDELVSQRVTQAEIQENHMQYAKEKAQQLELDNRDLAQPNFD